MIISAYAIPGIPRSYSISDICLQVADYFNLPVSDLNKKTRKREIVNARQISMYFSKISNKGSLAEIGYEIGNKDHATVMYACKQVDSLYSTDKKYREKINIISSLLGIPIKMNNPLHNG